MKPGRLVQLWIALGLLVLTALFVNGPALRRSLRERELRRMSAQQLAAELAAHPGDNLVRRHFARAAARENELETATRELLLLLKEEPTDAELLNDLGVLYLLQARYYESLVALQAATQAKPDYASAWANLGRLHMATQMPYTARDELEKAVGLDSRSIETWCDLGEACQRTLNFSAAERAYLKALELKKDHVPALVGLGRVYFSLTQYDQARRRLDRALQLDPRNSAALLTLGRMILEMGSSRTEEQQARDLLNRAALSDPQEPEVYFDLGRLDLRQGRAEDAVRNFRRTLQLANEHPGATHQLARALEAAGRPDEADRVRKIFRNLSMLTREEGRLEELLRQRPNDMELTLRLASIYSRTGKGEMAALLMRQSKGNSPTGASPR